MKVYELIELLKQVPQDLLVYTEGCDCYGESEGITIFPDMHSDALLIARYSPQMIAPSNREAHEESKAIAERAERAEQERLRVAAEPYKDLLP